LAKEGNFPLNYHNYFTEIEEFFQSKRETWTLLTTLDWVLVESWKEQGIPLEVVLKGIDRAFSKAKRKINHLAYCSQAIDDVMKEEKEVRIEKPSLPDIPADDVRAYLNDLADKTAATASNYPEFASKINAVADSVRAIDPSRFRDAEQVLGALEERLIAILKIAVEESALIEIRRSVENELKPFRSSMTTEQLAMLEQQLWRRKLMEKHNVPRLSLFYLI
jgi:hypothetical protein